MSTSMVLTGWFERYEADGPDIRVESLKDMVYALSTTE
jgi:hypothetical protein